MVNKIKSHEKSQRLESRAFLCQGQGQFRAMKVKMKFRFLYKCYETFCDKIHVSFCERLQELFDYFPGEVPTSASVVPALRVIKLRNLPRLRRLCSQEESWGCLEHVEVISCNLLRNLPISANDAMESKKETLQPRFIAAGNIPTGSLGMSCYQSSNTIEEASPISTLPESQAEELPVATM
ncbi:hypothetical protein Bca52824_070174 [Brassica carinata]|uniref:Disease resistance protein n=1 Tax=Brassica carinata TaxID=52824 RepID=A0A8X7Q6A7_BRACI|nr:hypothetical protein Bca52824_070174 [Brassica carinata]